MINEVRLVGETFNLKEQKIEEIEKVIQKKLDEWSKPDLMKVVLTGGRRNLELRVYRKYTKDYSFTFPCDDEKMITCIDGDILLGRFGENQKIPVMPPFVPYGYLFNYEITEFVEVYKDNLKAIGVKAPKRIKVESKPLYVSMVLAA